MIKKSILVALLCLLGFLLFTRFGLADNGFDLRNSSIASELIFSGGPAKDGIPALDNPTFITANKADFLKPTDRVLAVVHNGITKAYPIKILNYHEIVNDDFNGEPIAVTYCPLCGSGIAYESRIGGKNYTFGVSGLLYNSDVLLYDRQTESLWSQILSKAISGPLKDQRLSTIALSHTTWQDWQQRHPDSLVLSTETGFNRDYQSNPYDGYQLDSSIWFPVTAQDQRYHPKELVMGIEIQGQFKAYPFSELAKITVPLIDTLANTQFNVHYSASQQTAIITDMTGKQIPTIMTFWFAWYAFHPQGKVFSAN